MNSQQNRIDLVTIPSREQTGTWFQSENSRIQRMASLLKIWFKPGIDSERPGRNDFNSQNDLREWRELANQSALDFSSKFIDRYPS